MVKFSGTAQASAPCKTFFLHILPYVDQTFSHLWGRLAVPSCRLLPNRPFQQQNHFPPPPPLSCSSNTSKFLAAVLRYHYSSSLQSIITILPSPHTFAAVPIAKSLTISLLYPPAPLPSYSNIVTLRGGYMQLR